MTRFVEIFPLRFWLRFGIGMCIGLTCLFLYGRSQTSADRARVAIEAATQANAAATNARTIAVNARRDAADVAKEHVRATLAECRLANQQRIVSIATQNALIVAAEGALGTPESLLRFAAYQQLAQRQIMKEAGKVRVCTIVALGLQNDQRIATTPIPPAIAPPTTTAPRSSAAPAPEPTTASPGIAVPFHPTTTTVHRPAPPPACARTHGRCRPKG